MQAGAGPVAVVNLGEAVLNVDFEGNSTGAMPWDVTSQDAEHAYMHARCSPADGAGGACVAKYGAYMEEQWDSHTASGLAHFLHAFQDSFSPGHAFHVYDGSVSWNHFWSDAVVLNATEGMIIDRSKSFIKQYMQQCPSW